VSAVGADAGQRRACWREGLVVKRLFGIFDCGAIAVSDKAMIGMPYGLSELHCNQCDLT